MQNDGGVNADEALALIPLQLVENQAMALEEVIQALVQPTVATPPQNEGQVLAMDSNTESSDDDNALPPPLIDDFDILANGNFPNLQNLPHF